MKPRILIADDHAIMRDGLRSVLCNDLHAEVVAQAEHGRQAVELARLHRPDIVVMDVNMPNMNGVEATRQIKGEVDNVRVIALSMHTDKKSVTDMLNAGASAYILKHCAMDELEHAIAAVMKNEMYLSPRITSVVLREYLGSISSNESRRLTPKERQIVQLIAEGKSSKEIAALCSVSITTIDTHRQHIMEKLSLHSVAELTKYAIREGLTPLE